MQVQQGKGGHKRPRGCCIWAVQLFACSSNEFACLPVLLTFANQKASLHLCNLVRGALLRFLVVWGDTLLSIPRVAQARFHSGNAPPPPPPDSPGRRDANAAIEMDTEASENTADRLPTSGRDCPWSLRIRVPSKSGLAKCLSTSANAWEGKPSRSELSCYEFVVQNVVELVEIMVVDEHPWAVWADDVELIQEDSMLRWVSLRDLVGDMTVENLIENGEFSIPRQFTIPSLQGLREWDRAPNSRPLPDYSMNSAGIAHKSRDLAHPDDPLGLFADFLGDSIVRVRVLIREPEAVSDRAVRVQNNDSPPPSPPASGTPEKVNMSELAPVAITPVFLHVYRLGHSSLLGMLDSVGAFKHFSMLMLLLDSTFCLQLLTKRLIFA